jgi:hypothetical protein
MEKDKRGTLMRRGGGRLIDFRNKALVSVDNIFGNKPHLSGAQCLGHINGLRIKNKPPQA